MAPILILGGYGVFGGRLARRLAADGHDVIVAGRDFAQAEAHCAKWGGRPLRLDRASAHFAAQIAHEQPFVIVDAAGPFQDYCDYRIAKIAISTGAHYLDLSDDSRFTAGVTALDEGARAAGVCVLSGVSSTPALSAAAVAALRAEMEPLKLIETTILPGNRAPRGLSVIRAIVSQAGKPLRVWRGGAWREVDGWGASIRADLRIDGRPPIEARRASFIGAPELTLFPDYFHARSVLFRAGLELRLMHDGLVWLGRIARHLGIFHLERAAPALKWIADRLYSFGGDRGGMSVRVVGRTQDNKLVARRWTLIAENGDGPEIPAIPAAVLINKLCVQQLVPPGARACLDDFTLAEAQAAMARHAIATQISEEPATLFQAALGDDYVNLPAPIRALHEVADAAHWRGRASVERGAGWLARLIGALIGLPEAGAQIAVDVTMLCKGEREIWTRNFAGRRFRSVLSARKGVSGQGALTERFGPLSVDLQLVHADGRLQYAVVAARFFGAPLPRFALPSSQTYEHVDAQGRACFDVTMATPLTGLVARYRGWLERAQ